jgi:hypothetical protein
MLKAILQYTPSITIVAVFGTLVGLVAGFVNQDLISGTAFFLVCLSLVIIYTRWKGVPKPILAILLLAFSLRAATAIADSVFLLLPYSWYDAVKFDRLGWEIASAWRRGRAGTVQASFEVSSYAHWISVFYYLVGHLSLLIRLLNATLGTLTIYNVYRITLTLFDPPIARRAVGFAAVLPSLVMFSATPLRDSLVIFLISEYVWLSLLWIRTSRLKYLALTLFVTIFVGLFRTENLPIYWIPLIPSLTLYLRRWVKATIVGPIPVVLFIGLSLLAMYLTLHAPGFSKLQRTSIAYLGDLRDRRARGEAVYLEGYSYSSWGGLLKLLPIGATYFLFAPFPWQVTKLTELLASAEAILLLALVLLSISGFRQAWARDRQSSLFLLLYLVVGIGLYGVVDANTGTALRHRSQFIWLLFVFASYPLTTYRIVWGRQRSGVRSLHV